MKDRYLSIKCVCGALIQFCKGTVPKLFNEFHLIVSPAGLFTSIQIKT